jgi:uncharacterized membrane protein (Fun14 family)
MTTTKLRVASRTMSIESFGSMAATLDGGFFVGVLIGYFLKKVIKIVAVIVGLFLAGLVYLQYHQIANINWNKLQTVSEGVLMTVANLTMQIPSISSGTISDNHAAATASSLAMNSFGIPLTGSMSAGFAIGFMKG